MTAGPIIGGQQYYCTAPVLTWRDHGLEFQPGHGARERRETVELHVVHVTGGEGAPPRMFSTLEKRELGVEFAVDVDGTIWQFCDPLEVDTFDAGYVNRRSVGTEIVNYGYRSRRAEIPFRGRDRPTYETTIHGRRLRMARSWPVQIASLLALQETLASCPKLSIARALPRDSRGELRTGLMTRQEVADYSGVIGHFHVSRSKIDPGTDVLDALAACGY